MVRRRRWAWFVLAVGLAGCGRGPAKPVSTGAEEAVKAYYTAVLRQDWAAAHSALDPDSQARCGREQFDLLAQNYRRRLGFEPREVRVRSCEEHGAEAIAHVVLLGQAGSEQRSYKDAITLRRSGARWGVVLPSSFGQGR